MSQSKLGWRFSFWIMFIVSALNALACILITPETVSMLLGSRLRVPTASLVWPCASAKTSAQADESERRRSRLYLEA